MAYSSSSSGLTCRPLSNLQDADYSKHSKRSMFLRWKWLGKSRDAKKSTQLVEQPRPRSPTRADTSYSTVQEKLSRPVLRVMHSVRDLQLLRGLSHVNSRSYDPSQGHIPSPRVLCLPFQSPPPELPERSCLREATSPLPLGGKSKSRNASRFLLLPQEIRDKIYAYVFYSTRLTMGRRVACLPESSRASTDSAYHSFGSASSSPSSSPDLRARPSSSIRRQARSITQIKPARNSMALFLVCRQVTRELRSDDAWLGQVLFNFEDAATMMDILGGALTPKQRRLVREVRVREASLFVHQRMPSHETPYSSSGPTPPSTPPHERHPHPQPHHFRHRPLFLGGLMRLLPGLQLDRLTILPELPCRVHKSTRCLNIPSVDMYSMTVDSSPPPPLYRAAPHDILAELMHTGCGWRELCYVHHDTNMLAADRAQPSSLEAMMVNMGFWDADSDAYDEVFAEAERAEQEERERLREEASAAAATVARLPPGSGMDALRRHGLGSLYNAYAARKEYRLPRWRHILAERDGLVQAASKGNLGIDTVADEGFYEGQTARSTVSVYGVRAGRALWAMETLEDVHHSRLRRDDFMVIVRRGAATKRPSKRPSSSRAVDYVEAGAPYPFKEGDPRTLGYGSRWETLRPVLFPWDHLQVTRCRRDRYQHRDEYIVRSQKS